MVEKDHYTNEVIQQKREYVAMRRDMAIRSMVEVTSTRRYKSLLQLFMRITFSQLGLLTNLAGALAL
eukprot:COSAG02_NODE_8301_length_2625_cov_1.616390_2_plen_67_part_00